MKIILGTLLGGKIMVNGKNYKDNRECRVSIVAFSLQIDVEEFASTCLPTNLVDFAKRNLILYL